MENFDQPLDVGLDPGEAGEGLEITPVVRNAWREISGWTLFLGILCFLVTGLMILGLLLMVVVSSNVGTAVGPAIFILLVMSGLIFFPGWFYFKFATLMRQSLRYESAASLEAGFGYLKRYYRFMGIFTIVIFSIYLMVRIFSTATGSGDTPTPEF